MLQIAAINQATEYDDSVIREMLPAFESQWNNDLRPIWGGDQSEFIFCPKGASPPAGSWWLVFLDNSDQADALAYHDLTTEGLPISKVFIKTLQADHASISVGATHELCEMAVDPWLNSAYQDESGTFWAGEICDPVESDSYSYKIGQTDVTNFVTPNWFGHKYVSGPFDFKKHVTAEFEVLDDGYAQKFDPAAGWQQVSGSKAMKTNRATAPRGSRRDRRARRWTRLDQWERSAPKWDK